MLSWVLLILIQLGAADQILRALSPGESSPIPDIQTHYGTSTIKLHIVAERVDHIQAENLPGNAEVSALSAAVPQHFQ